MHTTPHPRFPGVLLVTALGASSVGCLDWNSPRARAVGRTDGGVDAATGTDPELSDGEDAGAEPGLDDGAAVPREEDGSLSDADTVLDSGSESGRDTGVDPATDGASCVDALCTADAPCTVGLVNNTCYGRYADYSLPVRTSGTLPAEQGFEVRADEVRDLRTGLTWRRRCDLTLRSLAEARAACDALPGDGRYHLADVHELSTLWGSARAFDLDDGVFNGCAAEVFHTATRDPSAAGMHFVLKTDMTLGSWRDDDLASGLCVRTEELTAVAPADRFQSFAGGALVYDPTTYLLWEAFVPAARYAVDHEAAVAYCAALTTDGRAFRLPTAAELTSMIDYAAPEGSRLPPAFTGRTGFFFWSSTRRVGDPTLVVEVSDSGEMDSVAAAGARLAVRCVSDEFSAR